MRGTSVYIHRRQYNFLMMCKIWDTYMSMQLSCCDRYGLFPKVICFINDAYCIVHVKRRPDTESKCCLFSLIQTYDDYKLHRLWTKSIILATKCVTMANKWIENVQQGTFIHDVKFGTLKNQATLLLTSMCIRYIGECIWGTLLSKFLNTTYPNLCLWSV